MSGTPRHGTATRHAITARSACFGATASARVGVNDHASWLGRAGRRDHGVLPNRRIGTRRPAVIVPDVGDSTVSTCSRRGDSQSAFWARRFSEMGTCAPRSRRRDGFDDRSRRPQRDPYVGSLGEVDGATHRTAAVGVQSGERPGGAGRASLALSRLFEDAPARRWLCVAARPPDLPERHLAAFLNPLRGTAASAPSTAPALADPPRWSHHWRSGGPMPLALAALKWSHATGGRHSARAPSALARSGSARNESFFSWVIASIKSIKRPLSPAYRAVSSRAAPARSA
jgi:hypothetical protein